MKEKINDLINLQEIDTEIAGFDRKIEEKKQEIMLREQAIAEKEAAIAECRQKIDNLDQKHQDVTAEHQDAGIRVKDRQNKMIQVQTSREHQALLKEIEENKKLFKETEEELLTIMEQAEEEEKNAKELENLCSGERETLAEETDAVNKAIDKIIKRRNTVTRKRNKLADDLKAPLLKRYNILLDKREGLAVVQAIDGVCQGCHMTLPPQQFNDVRKGDKMNFCPTCQRILYFKDEESETADA